MVAVLLRLVFLRVGMGLRFRAWLTLSFAGDGRFIRAAFWFLEFSMHCFWGTVNFHYRYCRYFIWVKPIVFAFLLNGVWGWRSDFPPCDD